jgi:hypothetical protein
MLSTCNKARPIWPGSAASIFTSLEVIVIADMLCVAHKPEARMMAAMVARREVLTGNTGNLVHIVVHPVMGYFVNAGKLNFVSWLVLGTLGFFDSGHSGLLCN